MNNTVTDYALLPLEKVSVWMWLAIVLATVMFLAFWRRDAQRWGVISFNSWFFGYGFYLKIFLMYPFALSLENIRVVGRSFETVLENLDHAFVITLGGIVCMLIGMALSRLSPRPHLRVADLIFDALRRGWFTRVGAFLAALIAISMSLLLLTLGFQVFAGRTLVFERPELRPIFNLWYEVVPFCAIVLILWGVAAKKRTTLWIGVAVLGLGFIGGTRTTVILTAVTAGICVAMVHRLRRTWLLIFGAVALLGVAVLMKQLRDGDVSQQISFGRQLSSTFYNGDISDLREFAWTLSGFDDQSFYYGRTYVAGWLAFIPSYISDFRTTYGIGRVTARLAGLDPDFHSGLRPPVFGEPYLNFGWVGVILGGLWYGFVVGRLMRWIRQGVDQDVGVDRYARVWAGFLMLQIIDAVIFSGAFFAVYILAALLMVGRLIGRGERRRGLQAT
ncbi:O-antigen polymerase [Roseiterribacter gracilis]|uniref:Oligosaccharide repeat unit polymerase n=1 Tax=Roseiterribacter gracilis TaxID=2812848 RepID=A0A8S8X745_9PROT|nr:hypothetical protein TMPK1_03110 [Rhodospirillales bacterium TMPK1]